ncbi:hypothetical protein LXL04_001070 [Taraxacum kok-saghyz]
MVSQATYTCLGDPSVGSCSEQEHLALLKFKHGVRFDPSGILSSWVGNDCCMWEGIQCDIVTGNVESLYLRGDDEGYLVVNETNFSLAELSHLKYLDLSGNYFGWSRIPDLIGSLKELTYLNLSHAAFQGIIPPYIGNLSNLKVLDLSLNDELIVDDMTWTSGLLSLEHLDLSSVNLGGTPNKDMVFYMIPSLYDLSLSRCGLTNADIGPFLNSSIILPNIKRLDLSYNFFEGPLPGFFQNMTSLTFLDISSFNLSLAWNFANLLSTAPSLSELHLSNCWLDKTHLSSHRLNFSTLSNIQNLDLSNNLIGGMFPSFLTNMSSLRVLDLSENMMNSLVPILPNLLHLDLSYNRFKQMGDVGIWRRCHLKQLYASHNQFETQMIESPKNLSECAHYDLEWLDLSWSSNITIPEPLGSLSNLRGIILSNCGLIGPIPESIGRLRYLEVLDLSGNQLTGPNFSKPNIIDNHLNGSIPESIGNLVSLTDLDLSSNRFKGPIPSSIGRLLSLRTIQMYSNLLNGIIPVSIGQLAKLQKLDLSHNSLEGVVSQAHFANLSMLKYLDTSSNTKLTFNVSPEWTPPFQLVSLSLSSCKIINGFPNWLQNQRMLGTLVLSNATISGPLPTWLRKMPIIPLLDLSHNKLSGPMTNLPMGEAIRETYDWYGSVTAPVIFLEDNIFNESIPRSLCRRTDLEYLDLSKNRLSGEIPKCFKSLQRLYTMILSSNQLSGGIPNIVALKSLFSLKLNHNKFFGELPRELGNLKDLSILDMGDNKLFGSLPAWIGEKSTNLEVLRLHKNNFSGRIPRSWCKAPNLHILDVAHNNLKGLIPRCLGELNAMVNDIIFVQVPYDYANDEENVDQVIKGVDREYTTTWYLVVNMDLSSNKLVGKIPVELTALSMLMGLNLSNNNLNGGIPVTIGNMTKLESLDLSGNKLTGMIPTSMGDLTFLSHLNVSHNNLRGKIPTGRQLQTLVDPSIYEGNKDLCGPPLPNSCSNPTTSKNKYEATDVPTKVWLFDTDITCGFATGFCGVIVFLLLKKHWIWIFKCANFAFL